MAKADTISILGCGWLGLPLGEYMRKAGWQVKGSTTSAEKLPVLREKGIEAYQLQVGEKGLDSSLSEFFNSQILFINIPPGRKRADVEQRFPQQIEQIVAAAIEQAIPRVLFISSTSVYGNTNDWVDEESNPAPQTASGRALLKAEQYLQTQTAFETTILRMAGLVGGDRQAGRFFAGKTDVLGGEVPVNMLHREDAILVIASIIQQEKWATLFNVCADEHPLKKDFYPKQAQKIGLTPPTFLSDDQKNFKKVSNAKLKQALNYSFKHPDPMDF